MNAKYIQLPSGTIISWEHVAFVAPVNGGLQVCFAATYVSEPLKLNLRSTDEKAFVQHLQMLGIDTDFLTASLKNKQNSD